MTRTNREEYNFFRFESGRPIHSESVKSGMIDECHALDAYFMLFESLKDTIVFYHPVDQCTIYWIAMASEIASLSVSSWIFV